MPLYKALRLHTGADQARRYHLFDAADQLVLVADQGSPWLPDDTRRQVRLARPDGLKVATLDFPTSPARPGKGQPHALMVEHAVYALITTMIDEYDDQPERRLVVEVEGNRWVGLRPDAADDRLLLGLYDSETTGTDFNLPDESDPMAPIGQVRRAVLETYDLEVLLPSATLAHAGLLAASLVFLVDTSGPEKKE